VAGGSVKGLTGRWRIVEMDMWDRDAIELVGPGFVEFAEKGTGEFGFIAVPGRLDCRWSDLGDESGFRATPFAAGAGDAR
jgi:hypothetical protein